MGEHEERAWATSPPPTRGQRTAIIKSRLKSIQYRPDLIDGFLTGCAHLRTRTAVDLSLCSTSLTCLLPFRPPARCEQREAEFGGLVEDCAA
jgi:hypothetical protein